MCRLTPDSPLSWSLRANRGLGPRGNAGYQVRISDECEDPDWDAFLAASAGGHHVQTSLWAQVKAVLGWRAVRVVVTRDNRIVAGAQTLIRPLSFAGAIGYVPRGPLFALDDPALTKLVIDKLHQVANTQRIRHLVVQPPSNDEALIQHLSRQGFRLSLIEAQPTATVLIDLTLDLDATLAQMHKATRRNIRRGQRRGVTVRQGTASDLRTFYRLLVTTSQRQGFSPEPEEYFAEMWRVLGPHGHVRLFLAEYDGEAVSAHLVIPFGDTVVSKKSAWSGRHGRRHPNEALDWTVIKWAKSRGYRYYDFEGIEPTAARILMNGDPLTDSLQRTPTSFKLGFGGQVTLFPHAYDYIYNPFLRWAYLSTLPKLASSAMVKKALDRLLRG